jgi:hypothetical protein
MVSVKLRLFMVAGAVVLLLVVTLSVPIVARSQIESTLTDLFKARATLASVSINPFSGHVVLRDITIENDIAVARLALTIDVVALLDRRIHVETLQVTGLRLPLTYAEGQLSIGQLQWPLDDGGDVSEAPSEASQPLIWQIDKLLLEGAAFAVHYGEQLHQLIITRLALAGMHSDMAREITYEIDMLVAASHLAASGGVSLASPVSVTSQLQAEVRLDDWQAYLPVTTTGDLRLSQQVAFSQGDEIRFDTTGSAQLDEFELEGALPVAVRRLTWYGKSQLSVVTGGAAGGASGGTSGSAPDTLPRVTAEGVLSLTDVAVEPFGSIKQLSIENVLLDAGLMTVEDVRVSGLNVTLQRRADGSIEGLPTESKDDETLQQAPTEAIAEAPAPLWLIDTLTVDGQLLFSDASVEPSVALRLQDIDLKVSQMGPGQESAFNLQANHQEDHQTGGLTLQGKGFLLDDPLNAEMVLALSDFEVHQLSAYLGNGVRSGRMALDANINIKQRQIKATNRIRINGLKVDAGQSRKAQSAGLPLSMALDLLKDGDGHIDLTVPIESNLLGLGIDTSDIINTALLNAARKAAFTYVQQALQPWGALMLLKNVAEVASRPRFVPVEFPPGSSDLDSEPQRYVTQIATLLKRRPALTVTLCGVATQTDRQSLTVGPSIAELTEESLQTTPVAEAAEYTSEDVVQDEAVPEPVSLVLAIDRGVRVTNQLVELGISVERLFACRPSYVADDSSPRVEISL